MFSYAFYYQYLKIIKQKIGIFNVCVCACVILTCSCNLFIFFTYLDLPHGMKCTSQINLPCLIYQEEFEHYYCVDLNHFRGKFFKIGKIILYLRGYDRCVQKQTPDNHMTVHKLVGFETSMFQALAILIFGVLLIVWDLQSCTVFNYLFSSLQFTCKKPIFQTWNIKN